MSRHAEVGRASSTADFLISPVAGIPLSRRVVYTTMMLVWRLSLGTVFIAALAALAWLDQHASHPGTYLFPLALALSVAASGELLGLFAAREIRPVAWIVNGGNLLIVASNLGPLLFLGSGGRSSDPLGTFGWPAAALALALLAAFASEMGRYTGPGRVTETLAAAMLAFAYVGLLLTFVVQLRLVDGGRVGVAALLSLVIVVKMCDTGAYTVGRLIGRHKMAPVLSPKKTVEGAIGGLTFACFGSWATLQWMAPAISHASRLPAQAWGWLAYGLLIGGAGMLGDLAESLLKRDLGRKDSSTWMPGFGGVLDVLDSILLAAPVAYLCWAFGLV
ncbi:MAG TPA: phosphatidate cytidylyltransferase [Pirellulales bacterium]|nr:phosphatidate cytidylyltransferase [Pirellulales bacterium]